MDDDDERQALLQMPDSQLLDIAHFCNCFPNIDMSFVVLDITLERDLEGQTEIGPIDATRYPIEKEELWWLVVGDNKIDQLLAINRVALQRRSKVQLNFTAPVEVGKKAYMLYFMSDSYLGCDQEYGFPIDVKGTA
ncbi:DExH-box ATP-dependent RNA helicase DExH12-like protein [Cinnamomum micranthum f. kanehirae]|uniref:DExH-box ATP-dependent RNA helicase DExH12-like protein n=1 Tax=Cinnamomum micranthum f. kanehirae TaxID=337451 RepID=A0A3S3PN60_9MAGN|nr:DExH-box ATP-dependent RNA helicase DExH12-like protein [Cinnamomum micranthum f. kanehirae]